MNLESPKVTLDKSAEETFNFLSDVKNFEKLMPENISKFEVLDTDKFLFALKGMPEIVLKKKEATPNSKIVLGAAGGKLDFALTADITEIEANKSDVKLNFSGEFNAMMAMMIKGPINKFLETLATNMPTAV
ncbi:orotate phosphoribosyltransferase [Winogradskyella sp. PC-19]|jgi:carbon monoxide dehydrogenase subunit G|uniref:orotate phosphoribosyltransferase n=1 Tax=unclassified Winogradskyella TaxID=2615021 RepID=UPI000B3CD76E|nr:MULTISPECIES: orotate phosphoribosyltransferase [unclassified Winogradskyella]ARV09149.1 orotate phosphoribosyltransferase [Winogradskyella sp. PC-19]RZN74942.1 MAG: SRPBCC family protein [Winogradskyella sp.]